MSEVVRRLACPLSDLVSKPLNALSKIEIASEMALDAARLASFLQPPQRVSFLAIFSSRSSALNRPCSNNAPNKHDGLVNYDLDAFQ